MKSDERTVNNLMRVSAKCSVALHCLILISEFQDQAKITSELLAQSTGCNAATIRSILNPLQKCGIIAIKRGVGGAYLKQPPKEITMWSVYHALEPDDLSHLIGLHPNPSENCPVGRQIYSILKKPYADIGEAVRKEMGQITLQQLLDDYCKNEYEHSTLYHDRLNG